MSEGDELEALRAEVEQLKIERDAWKDEFEKERTTRLLAVGDHREMCRRAESAEELAKDVAQHRDHWEERARAAEAETERTRAFFERAVVNRDFFRDRLKEVEHNFECAQAAKLMIIESLTIDRDQWKMVANQATRMLAQVMSENAAEDHEGAK